MKNVDALRTTLDRVRRQGFAVTDQELEEGLRTAAVPVRDASGHGRRRAQRVRAREPREHAVAARGFLPRAQETAVAIEAELRTSGLRVPTLR